MKTKSFIIAFTLFANPVMGCVIFAPSITIPTTPLLAPKKDSLTQQIDLLLPLLAHVESNGNPKAVGDGGKAIGIYQIHESYWQDATQYDKTIGGKYQDCFDSVYAERIVRAYFRRYAPKNATIEQLARLHNGGCNILKKQNTKAWENTTKYWQKIVCAQKLKGETW